jgi:hypothetical protein
MARIALIGDSHSQIHFNQIRPELEEAGHEVVFRSSKPGWGVKKFLSTGELNDLASNEPEMAVVALGGNNFKLEKSYGDQMQEFINYLRETGIDRIVWLGPFESNAETRGDVQDRHQWTADFQDKYLPKDKNIFWIDMRPPSLGGPWRDGVHFSRDKYQEMTDAVMDRILGYIKKPMILLRPHRTSLFWGGIVVISLGVGYLLYSAFRSDDVY